MSHFHRIKAHEVVKGQMYAVTYLERKQFMGQPADVMRCETFMARSKQQAIEAFARLQTKEQSV